MEKEFKKDKYCNHAGTEEDPCECELHEKEFKSIKELEAENDICNRRGTLDKITALKDVLELFDERIDEAHQKLKTRITDNMREFLNGLIRNLEELKARITGEEDWNGYDVKDCRKVKGIVDNLNDERVATLKKGDKINV